MKTQSVIYRKHLGWKGLRKASSIAAGLALRGQTNFLRMLWKFNGVYNPERQYADHDHFRPVRYRMKPPPFHGIERPSADALYVHNRRA